MTTNTRATGTRRAGVVLVLFALLLPIALPALAASLSAPSSASPGDTITVSGKDFSGMFIDIHLDGSYIDRAVTDLNGSFSETVRIPRRTQPGEHTLTATSAWSKASTTIQIDDSGTTTSTTTTSSTTTTTPPPVTTTAQTTTTTLTANTTTTAPTTTTTSPTTTTTPPVPLTSTSTADPATTTQATSTTTEATTATTDQFNVTSGTTPGTLPSDEAWVFGGGAATSLAGPLAVASPAPNATLTIDPAIGQVGTTVELALSLDGSSGALDTVNLTIDGIPLGSRVSVWNGSVTVERTVPDLQPGRYTVQVLQGDAVLATTEFEVVAPATAAAPADADPGPRWLAVPIIVIVVALGAMTTKRVLADVPRRSHVGPIGAWLFRRRRPL